VLPAFKLTLALLDFLRNDNGRRLFALGDMKIDAYRPDMIRK